MLYHIHTASKLLLNPFIKFAGLAASCLKNPLSPFAHLPYADRTAAAYELMHRLGKDYAKPAFGITEVTVKGKQVAVTEEVAVQKPFCRLLHFKKASSTKQPTVLLVAPLSGHHATLLRDTARALLSDHDVYITDWTDARSVPLSAGAFHLHDYIYYVQEFIRLLGPDLHVISVCQPTVPVLAAISLMATANDPKLPKTMVMMGGPIDPRQSPTAVNNLATEKPYSWFESQLIHSVPSVYPGFGRKVYPGFLQHTGFVAMNPQRHAQSHREFFDNLVKGNDEPAEAHRQFYNEYNAVLDMDAHYYLETIKIVFQEFRLPLGTWEVEGKLVRPQDIQNVALFTIEGELDDIAGIGQTQAAHGLCTGLPAEKKKHLTAEKCGHYGIFSGRRWRENICPQITEFIKQNS
jgi:poly(3-hydroxybutyrate) depolymerase